MKIRVLEDRVVNQIAAGEVVERPISVVREAVDNALDAGASEIRVYLEAGGRSLIRVSDNGFGMDRQDALLAFERHATSKIKTVADLKLLGSYGFRGEALASIAAVSKVSLKTRTKTSDHATEVVIYGGKLKDVTDVPGNRGTTLSVRNLFFNTPARKKFLTKEKTEERKVLQWIRAISLGRPEVSFVLYLDQREVLSLRARKDIFARAEDLYQGSLVKVKKELNGMQLEGLLGHPGMATTKSSGFVILVNNRVVSDSSISKAVREGFDNTLKLREFPVGFVSLAVDPKTVDVNVHPQKSEVRFEDRRAIYGFVHESVLQAINDFRSPVRADSLRPVSVSHRVSSDFSKRFDSQQWSTSGDRLEYKPVSSNDRQQNFISIKKEALHNQEPEHITESFSFSSLRYVGMILSCYLLCEHEQKFIVVDMHAAHERYNFNLIRNALAGKELAAQVLLVPININLDEDLCRRVEDYSDWFNKLGFDIEVFSESSLVVRALPSILAESDIGPLVREVLSTDYAEQANQSYKDRIDTVAARMACHASVRSGDSLTREEVYALFSDLDKSEFSAACPHGRPVIVSFSKSDVESWFGRDR